MLFDDAPAERQPEARPLARGLRGEERIEDLPLDIRGDAGAGVRDGQLEPRPGRIQSRRDLDPTEGGLAAHRLMGIGDEVHEHLVELMGIGPEHRQLVGQVQDDLDAVRPKLVAQQLDRVPDDLVELRLAPLGRVLARHGQEIPHDPGAALRGGPDRLRLLDQRWLSHQIAHQIAMAGDDR